MYRHPMLALAFGVALALGGAASAGAQSEDQSTPRAEKNDYGKAEAWLCRPGRKDDCAVDLSTTIVAADGALKTEKWVANPDAPIDCFYVYPTVSLDTTPNSDMQAGPEEASVIRAQFARFASQCRVYAPLYRQVTLTALRAGLAGQPMTPNRGLAYDDVADAWRYYLEHDNQGRGVVLIGHSQGSGLLTQLIQKEVEGKPVHAQLVSALLLGTNLQVPRGKDVGGSFKETPLCKSASQTGCAVTYASFRSTTPPPANSRFARAQNEDMVSACTNPAALAGGSAELHSYLSSGARAVGAAPAAQPPSWVKPPKPIETPFVSVPGLISAECKASERGSYLSITVHGNPADPRTDDIAGDVVRDGKVQADWGLHLIDVNLAMGDLIDIVSRQSKAYLAAKAK